MLERITIDDAVRTLRPDFAVLLMTTEGLVNAPSGDALLRRPELPRVNRVVDAYNAVSTHITDTTKNALFILERLAPYPLESLRAAGDELAGLLRAITPDVTIATRLVEP